MIFIAPFMQTNAEERNLLEKNFTESQIESCLVMNQKWVPYPAYNDRTGWDKLLGNNKETVIKAGEKDLGYNWIVVKATDYLEFERSGSRAAMQDPNNKNTGAFASLLMAELAEGKGRFIDDIINGILYFSEMTSWAESAHLMSYQKSRRAIPDYRENILELSQGDKAQMMAWTYYFLHQRLDKVDKGISARLLHELQRRELTPYLQRNDFWWMALEEESSQFVNNWNPWCNANALLCFMLLENDRDVLAKAVYKSMTSVDKFLNYVKYDGACEEGPSYWGHAAGKMFDYLSALSLITGGKVSLFNEPQVRNMGEYISNSYIGDNWVVNFADASARFDESSALIYRYGAAVNSNEMKSMAAQRYKKYPETLPIGSSDISRFLETCRTLPQMEQDRSTFQAPDFVWYPETEFCYMRSQHAFFAAKGGYNEESHNHNDVGSFILYFDDTPVMIDAGVGTYNRQTFSEQRYDIWTMQSNYHNLPMINGVPQKNGPEFKATDTKADKRNLVFCTDIAKAYPAAAAVDKWTRCYRLGKEELLISDSFTLKEAKAANKINFLTWGNVDISHQGTVDINVNGKHSQLEYDPEVFEASLETINLTDVRLSNVWGNKIYRITLTAKSKVKSGTYKYRIIRKA